MQIPDKISFPIVLPNTKICFFNPHQRICLLILEREEGRERIKNIDMREKHQSVACYMLPDWGSNTQPRYVP